MKEICPTCGHALAADPDQRVVKWLIDKLAKTPDGLTGRQLALAISSKDRSRLKGATQFAIQQGMIGIDAARRRYMSAHR